MDGKQPYLKRCDLAICEGLCCYDGVYLEPGEDRMLRAIVKANPEVFSELPKVYLLTGRSQGMPWVKTATRTHIYQSRPAHFKDTRCVFAQPDGKCRLQLLAIQEGKHPFSYKPRACWLHPLRVGAHGVIAPPPDPEQDQEKSDDYPGFVTYTPCGQHDPDGEPWDQVLAEELDFLKTFKQNSGKYQE